ncbi:hypothetical protein [Achromobacter phage Motura]|uniref:Uncharacterized protein n=1 Tax=Achromobacter phage Motura TaxID=2591403 RepID=A0A514CSS7_9CAUD|nr:hypothetical protein H1O15_gp251 [Achromobacter phage Motura]QDH83537.1 hypothetical protein [Achromobacter phage Motura]
MIESPDDGVDDLDDEDGWFGDEDAWCEECGGVIGEDCAAWCQSRIEDAENEQAESDELDEIDRMCDPAMLPPFTKAEIDAAKTRAEERAQLMREIDPI